MKTNNDFFFFYIYSISGNKLWLPRDVTLPLEEEGKGETMGDKLTSTSILIPLH